jgi:hypothetical protein
MYTINVKFCHRIPTATDSNHRPQALQVHGISSSSIKVSWRLTPPPATLPHHIRQHEPEEVDGFYILYRPSVGRPPGFTSITVLHAAATRYHNQFYRGCQNFLGTTYQKGENVLLK